MRFGSTAKVLLKCKLKYYRISECNASDAHMHAEKVAMACRSVIPAGLEQAVGTTTPW